MVTIADGGVLVIIVTSLLNGYAAPCIQNGLERESYIYSDRPRSGRVAGHSAGCMTDTVYAERWPDIRDVGIVCSMLSNSTRYKQVCGARTGRICLLGEHVFIPSRKNRKGRKTKSVIVALE